MVKCDPSRPLGPHVVERAIRDCLKEEGSTVWSKHARDELEADDLVEGDILNALRCGRVDPSPELVNFHWRYRVSTDRIGVVATFEPEDGEIRELWIITVWRIRRRGI